MLKAGDLPAFLAGRILRQCEWNKGLSLESDGKMAEPAVTAAATEPGEGRSEEGRSSQLALDLPPAPPRETMRDRDLTHRLLSAAAALLGVLLAAVLVFRDAEDPVISPPAPVATAPIARIPAAETPIPVMEPVKPAVKAEEMVAPPAVTPAELPAWRRYAVAAPIADGRPRIAVVIDDMGVDRRNSEAVAALPGPLTLSYLPYGRDLPAQTAAARARGHELLLHLPMEPEGRTADPGPTALSLGLPEGERLRRLAANLGRFDAYVGVNNHMGSRFTADAAAMTPVLAELKARGLLFLDSRTTSRTVGARLARDMGVPYAERDIFLDNERDPAAIRRQLMEAEARARRNGAAIVIGHPHPETVQSLREWLGELETRGFELVPLTALVHAPEGEGER